MCSHSLVLYLVVHRQSWHCHTSPNLPIFCAISCSNSSKNTILGACMCIDEQIDFSCLYDIYFCGDAKHS